MKYNDKMFYINWIKESMKSIIILLFTFWFSYFVLQGVLE